MIWSTKNKPFRDCSLWYRGCYAIGWAIEGCPGKGILDNPHILYIYIISYCIMALMIFPFCFPMTNISVAFDDSLTHFERRELSLTLFRPRIRTEMAPSLPMNWRMSCSTWIPNSLRPGRTIGEDIYGDTNMGCYRRVILRFFGGEFDIPVLFRVFFPKTAQYSIYLVLIWVWYGCVTVSVIFCGHGVYGRTPRHHSASFHATTAM